MRGAPAAPGVVRQMDHQTGPTGAGPDVDGESGVPGDPAAEPVAGPATVAGEAAAEATGDPRVDAALHLLEQLRVLAHRLPGLPVSEHPELFEQVHAQLSDVLGELDPGSAGTVG